MHHASTPNIVHELDKKEGLHYAFTESGLELPVIDIGHPAFRVAKAKAVARRSILARELVAARGGFVSGLGTYLIKLGPELLGEGYASAVDRRIAGTVMGVNARIRLRETAVLLARSIEGRLAACAGRPLVLFAIAGGPSAESLNALLRVAYDWNDPSTLQTLARDAEDSIVGSLSIGEGRVAAVSG